MRVALRRRIGPRHGVRLLEAKLMKDAPGADIAPDLVSQEPLIDGPARHGRWRIGLQQAFHVGQGSGDSTPHSSKHQIRVRPPISHDVEPAVRCNPCYYSGSFA
ncbi:hypothetical protein G6F60_015449 [Rhizopus arrhizus]|nr:hypothetical protein G6F60_015449 [Rhizopus arrhizus]